VRLNFPSEEWKKANSHWGRGLAGSVQTIFVLGGAHWFRYGQSLCDHVEHGSILLVQGMWFPVSLTEGGESAP